MLSVAVVAIYGPIAPGQERYFGVLATFGAHCGMHFAPRSAIATTTVKSAVGASSLSACWASLGFVGVTFVRMILLVVSSKNENLIALYAG